MWPVIQKITYVFAIWPISCGTTTQPVIWKYMLCYLVRTCQQFGVGAPWFYQYCYISNNSKFLLCADHNVFLYKHSSLKRIIELLLMIFHFWISSFILWNWWKGLPLINFVLSIYLFWKHAFFSIIIYVFIFVHIMPAEYLSMSDHRFLKGNFWSRLSFAICSSTSSPKSPKAETFMCGLKIYDKTDIQ